MKERIKQAAEFLSKRLNDFHSHTGMILGSGLGVLADEVKDPQIVKYHEIPGFPVSTVAGHTGQIVAGYLSGHKVLIMQGRFHYYEGNSIRTVAMPVYVMKFLGIKTLILTNAAGGINRDFQPGDIMLITDHINMGFTNPLIGENEPELGPRFPDTSQTYSPALLQLAVDVARQLNIDLKQGVYQFMTGPCYETPAEVDMARFLGADAIGMSTFPEALAAVHCGMDVLGVSYIANMAAGITSAKLSHEEVLSTMGIVKDKFVVLLKGILSKLSLEETIQ